MEAIKWSEETLNNMLTEPSAALVEDLKRLEGDIMVLGAGGKMGPDICVLAKKASVLGGSDRKIYAVSRFRMPRQPNGSAAMVSRSLPRI